MRRANNQLALLAWVIGLTISIPACGTEHTDQVKMEKGPKDCDVMKDYGGSNRTVSIVVEQNGGISLNESQSDKFFWHNDRINWVVTSKPKAKKIENFQVHFYEYDLNGSGQCDTEDDAPQLWPCEEIGGEWGNGMSKIKKPNQTISCKVRNDALEKYQEGMQHGEEPPVSPSLAWNYCFVVTVWTDTGVEKLYSGDMSVMGQDPSGGGNGCGSCHAGTGY